MASSPETEARQALIKALEETYATEKFPVAGEKMHTARAQNQTEIAVYPERTHHAKNATVSEMFIAVQFFCAWEKKIDLEHQPDPAIVEAYLQRFREKLRSGIDPKTSAVWYFKLERVDFPTDPVLNLTRYEAHICALGLNMSLPETI